VVEYFHKNLAERLILSFLEVFSKQFPWVLTIGQVLRVCHIYDTFMKHLTFPNKCFNSSICYFL